LKQWIKEVTKMTMYSLMDKISTRPELLEDLRTTMGEEQVQLIMRNFPELREDEVRALDLSQAAWLSAPYDDPEKDEHFTPINFAVLRSMNVADKI
jgi:hypothetical protein